MLGLIRLIVVLICIWMFGWSLLNFFKCYISYLLVKIGVIEIVSVFLCLCWVVVMVVVKDDIVDVRWGSMVMRVGVGNRSWFWCLNNRMFSWVLVFCSCWLIVLLVILSFVVVVFMVFSCLIVLMVFSFDRWIWFSVFI